MLGSWVMLFCCQSMRAGDLAMAHISAAKAHADQEVLQF